MLGLAVGPFMMMGGTALWKYFIGAQRAETCSWDVASNVGTATSLDLCTCLYWLRLQPGLMSFLGGAARNRYVEGFSK